MNTNDAQPAPREADSPQLNADRARRIAEEVASTAKVPGCRSRSRAPRESSTPERWDTRTWPSAVSPRSRTSTRGSR